MLNKFEIFNNFKIFFLFCEFQIKMFALMYPF